MKKILWGGVVLALIVGTLALVMLFRNDTKEATMPPQSAPVVQNETSKVVTPVTGTDTLQSLLALGQNLECTISYAMNNAVVSTVTEGTYFTSRGRMRGDFIIPGVAGSAVSSMILTDGIMYTWTEIEGEKYGMKITLSDLEQSKSSDSAPDVHETVPLDMAVSYNCKPWVALDGSVFEVPTDVIFKDYKDLVNVGMEYGTSYGEGAPAASQCAACDELSGTEKAQCRALLSCD
jgi:hypothetical protein